MRQLDSYYHKRIYPIPSKINKLIKIASLSQQQYSPSSSTRALFAIIIPPSPYHPTPIPTYQHPDQLVVSHFLSRLPGINKITKWHSLRRSIYIHRWLYYVDIDNGLGQSGIKCPASINTGSFAVVSERVIIVIVIIRKSAAETVILWKCGTKGYFGLNGQRVLVAWASWRQQQQCLCCCWL